MGQLSASDRRQPHPHDGGTKSSQKFNVYIHRVYMREEFLAEQTPESIGVVPRGPTIRHIDATDSKKSLQCG